MRDGRLERARLAFELGDFSLVIGRDDQDGLYLMVRGGGTGCLRRVLREHGAIVLISTVGHRVFVSGVVTDEVTAVRVGDVPAYLRNKGFAAEINVSVAEIDPHDSPVVVITTPAGERKVGPSAP